MRESIGDENNQLKEEIESMKDINDQHVGSFSKGQKKNIDSRSQTKTNTGNKNYSESFPKQSEPNREDGLTDAFKFNNLVSSIFGALDFGQQEAKEEDHTMDEYMVETIDFPKAKIIKQKDDDTLESNFEKKEFEKSFATSQSKLKVIPKKKTIEPEIEHADLDDDFFEMFKKPKIEKEHEEVKIIEEKKADPISSQKPKNPIFLISEPVKSPQDLIVPDLETDNWNEDIDINIDSDAKSEPDQIPTIQNDQEDIFSLDQVQDQADPVSVQKSGKAHSLSFFLSIH